MPITRAEFVERLDAGEGTYFGPLFPHGADACIVFGEFGEDESCTPLFQVFILADLVIVLEFEEEDFQRVGDRRGRVLTFEGFIEEFV